CAAVSTPSATARSPNARAIWPMDVAIASCSTVPLTPSTKDLSTLMTSTGQVRSRPSEEWPVPKSSSAMSTPSACTAVTASTAGPPPNTAVSVISIVSICAGSPVAASTPATTCGNVGSSSCRAETFTAMRAGARSPYSSSHAAACRHAVSMTQAPSGTISPVRSATGMKSAGDTKPRSGWFQRTSASTPVMSPSGSATIGLVHQRELVAVQRLAQFGGEPGVLDGARVEVRVVVGVPALAEFLGRVHGDVGAAQQFGGSEVRVVVGDPDAGLGQQVVAGRADRGGERE